MNTNGCPLRPLPHANFRTSFTDVVMRCLAVPVVCAVIILMSGCGSPEPRAITYGQEDCHSCKMRITDRKFGAELVTSTGKTYVFDAPECMLGSVRSGKPVSKDNIHSLWVTDFVRPGTLINAQTAFYLESEMIRSPMGMNVAAFSIASDRDRAALSFPGSARNYDAVYELAADYEE
ncbi:MAG TPA: hypothetical protein DIS79_01055 [Bacteroidetes bacterium]|nr:hypothetical protein [Bacteroidota bacterium]HRK05077.1 nitrous oxide reductase accessory protein NosL [Chlorobiota bacterium]